MKPFLSQWFWSGFIFATEYQTRTPCFVNFILKSPPEVAKVNERIISLNSLRFLMTSLYVIKFYHFRIRKVYLEHIMDV